MNDSGSKFKSLFLEEDFEKVNKKYFKKIRENNSDITDPSGWQDTFTPVKSFLFNAGKNLHKYNTDLGSQLAKEKQRFIPLMTEWDLFEYKSENFTLCHSATIGSLITISVLQKLGIKTIFFETPCYYAGLYQAEDFGMNYELLPSYYSNNFDVNIDKTAIARPHPVAIWITQPRTSLGYNQDKAQIGKLLKLLKPADYLIIDEATEQFFPSHLAEFKVTEYNIIKIRSYFKGMGLNGIRLSYLSHSEKLRDTVVEEMEIYQGALDLYSMQFLKENAKDIKRFKLMLESSREQVRVTGEKLKQHTIQNECIEPSNIINGYIGSLFLKHEYFAVKSRDLRNKLLAFCRKEKMPLILGSSMRFPVHRNMEFVRLNYFNKPYHLTEAIKKLDLFFDNIR